MGEHRATRPRRFTARDALFSAVFLAIGTAAGFFAAGHIAAGATVIHDPGVRLTGEYKLVSPLLVCSSNEDEQYGEYASLQSSINSIVQNALKSGAATDVSVYFRGSGGQWVDINPSEEYAPASLLKVPIMIAYYKEAESDPGILSQTLTYTGSPDGNAIETFKSPNDLPPGTYTVDELIAAMIKYSDNNAEMLLSQNINQQQLSEVYTDLGLKLTTGTGAATESITAKEYAYFFRILRDATYLSPQDSEKALELLTESDFTQGIVAGVPANTPVAQKFGERTVQNTSGQIFDRELHDCGIVYATNHVYNLCIMTRGTDYTQLESVIQSISKAVYAQATK